MILHKGSRGIESLPNAAQIHYSTRCEKVDCVRGTKSYVVYVRDRLGERRDQWRQYGTKWLIAKSTYPNETRTA